MQRNPADDWYWLKAGIMDEMQALRDRVRDLEQQRQVYPQVATVSSYVSGAYCTVQFASGATMIVRIPFGYTPAAGHTVAVLVGPYLSHITTRLA